MRYASDHRTGRTPSQRQLRVGEAIRHVLATLLARGELRDPVLLDASITVSEVRISPDLKNATVFVLPLGGGQAAEVAAALKRAAPYLRSQVAKSVRLRHAPVLHFQTDTSFDEADRIDRLLHSDRVARDLDTGPEDGPEDGGDGDGP